MIRNNDESNKKIYNFFNLKLSEKANPKNEDHQMDIRSGTNFNNVKERNGTDLNDINII
jgi:hypothetical protein